MSALTIIKSIIGWVYFACWSLSFYPQVYLNFKKKNTKGLSHDFLFFNFTGFFFYSVFNSVLYWDKAVQQEYIEKYAPPIPVHPSDVAFAIHAFGMNLFIILQCIIFYKNSGNQKISRVGGGLCILLWIAATVVTILGFAKVVSWLWVIYFYSYVKLFITFVKYVPQAYVNYKNKCTGGWSIGSVLFDFAGGVLSLVEMFLDVADTSNWKVFTGDPVKIGLSLLSIAFDILFMIQHYILYRHNNNTTTNKNKDNLENVINEIKDKNNNNNKEQQNINIETPGINIDIEK
ncbi:hypothetical protein DICPUDRAFT_79701 [Dictyostelium purpureum]|uniref:Cystinosin homolog n=1 Tax=Dictyostelium purpureum TaxID=5786 RepID=F0ZND1_DICPU|nr:uncharacterized protein DICPUDRAFT_79701 [Dictyostelium purpureum]EGC34561.1 hypothetical protein DICPUDRAFT_79701 [Dictyostelium purpureum]|eukprot:XP_003288937.1 hypothetical protein DICPUDRAFT_79701 [Dictyostelium purpureum]